jgi:1,4-alpha-glucan branching enzyme
MARVESGLRRVEFVLMAPEASEVVLVGDFNGWRPGATPLRPSERQGIWSVTVPLSPGRHEYAFLVDGKHWLPDPRAPRAPTNDFGSPNSVLTVTERS